MNTDNYHFPLGMSAPKVRSAIVTGTGRSGKTTLGNILATCKNVEYQDEPWAMHTASVMASVGAISKSLGHEMFNAAYAELVNDTVLLRNANFRPSDLSTVLTKKSTQEIDARLKGFTTRDDVTKFLQKNDPLFLLAFSLDPAINLAQLVEFLPQSPIVHVVRSGFDVAEQVEGKKWFSDEQVRAPSQAQLAREVTYKGAAAFVYSWVPEGKEEEFLNLTPYERGLYYWCTLVEKSFITMQTAKHLVVTYEDLLAAPQETLARAMNFLGLEAGELTEAALSQLQERTRPATPTPVINEKLLARTQKLLTQLGYDN